ncbi:MAG: ACP S-malonyltransferase [Gammaproteobacteria bacterium]|nr:ACP S-malonyltransferase [Gammaproteobacteria bacterium]MCY4198836.1 ACP S-malonyltransferase [Gammaproteobacteria bacterium]MCY4323355.1 ACP S-malonyltransferase [Gammaproteobacteria bacterium]
MSLGLIFPGQGSQKVGMLADMREALPIVRHALDEADDALGFSVSNLMLEGPENVLGRTENTQPAMLAAGIAIARALSSAANMRPECVAGHSLGEYTALVFAEVMSFGDALRLVRLRGQAMQNAVAEGEGLMAAILGLDDEAIESVCDGVEGVVQPANYNAPGQVVISGEREAVQLAIEASKARGARRAMPLPVSVPAHSMLMVPAAQVLGEALEATELKAPTIPVLHNVDALSAVDLADCSRKLVRQVAEPVRFVDCVRAMQAKGATRLIECGPGGVLGGLVRRIDKGLDMLSCGNLESFEKVVRALAT